VCKKLIKNSQLFVKLSENLSGDFLTDTVHTQQLVNETSVNDK